ncbi:MAG: FHA domain-containing protein [Alphaproteobacteria bacterium]
MSADPGSAFTIVIETGLHAGTVRRLSPGIYTLGSELDADIILADDGVEAIHLIVELDQRGLRLEPLQGAIVIGSETADLVPGDERHLTFPTTFTIGATRIRITAPKDAARARRRLLKAAIAAGFVALAVLSIHIVDPFGMVNAEDPAEPAMSMRMAESRGAAAFEGSIDTASMTAPDLPAQAGGPAPSAADEPPQQPAVSLDQAAAALRARLAEEKLDDIDVRTGTDRLMVKGVAEPARLADWQAIRMWFDGSFGQEVLLVADVTPAEEEEPPKLAIEAVWSGEDPYLIAGGQRFAVGAHVGDGWTIGSIEPNEIIFERGGKSFSLTL